VTEIQMMLKNVTLKSAEMMIMLIHEDIL